MLLNSSNSSEIESTNNTLEDEETQHPPITLLLEIRDSIHIVKSLIDTIDAKILIELNQPEALVVRVKYGQHKILESSPYVKAHNVSLRPRPILRIKVSDNKEMKVRYLVHDNRIIRVKKS